MRPESLETDPFLFRRWWACAALLLFAATWRLWVPETDYPRVPLCAWSRTLPSWVDWLFACAMIGSLGVVAWRPEPGRVSHAALTTFAVACSALCVLDQHRLQPWAWQFVLSAVCLAGLAPAEAAKWLRILTIGIYFHSAVSKVDFSFLHGLGRLFLHTGLGWAGVSPVAWPEAVQVAAVVVFPVSELLIAAGLGLPRLGQRRPAMFAAMLMHVAMLALLGPWGLAHQPAVLLWNGWFLVQNWLLFASPQPAVLPVSERPARSTGGLFARLLIEAAVLLPFLEPWGFYDHWPAWGLYAARVERVELWLEGSWETRLPASLQSYLRRDAQHEHLIQLRIDRWSLGALGAPIYPQARFQVGVVLDFVDRHQVPDGEFHATVEGAADRWTGRRTQVELTTRAALEQYAHRYWLNARPPIH